MAYAQLSDMIAWCGEVDLVRLSTPRDAEMGPINQPVVQSALNSSASVIDSYLRRRYAVPLGQSGQTIPPEVIRCNCIMATHELAGREGHNRGEQIVTDYKNSMIWLKDVSDGRVLLDVVEAPSGDESFAQVSTRCPVYGGCDQSQFGYGSGFDMDYP